MSILLNDSELFAMRGLPHAALCLYIAIRQAMDMATGMVGIRSLISWRALTESLYIEPGPGRTESGSISPERIRKIANGLERAGLIKNCSNSSNRQLIFKCILASHDKSVKNKQHRQQHRPLQAANKIPARVLDFTKQEQHRQQHIHPSLVIYSIEKSSSITYSNDDDDDDRSTNSKPLIYPSRTEDWQQRMATMLRNIPADDAQVLLDELAGQMRSGRVSRPLGYFSRMIENYLRGDFRGELATGERAIRDQQERDARQRRADLERSQQPRDLESGRAILEKIKQDILFSPRAAPAGAPGIQPPE